MRVTSSAAFYWALLASATSHVNAKGLRRKLARNDCTILAIEALGLEGNEDPEMLLECELDPDDADGYSGISLPIEGTSAQLKTLKNMIGRGSVTPGLNKLNISGANIGNKKVQIPPGLDIADLVRQNGVKREGLFHRRRLVDTTGNLNMLLVRVTDSQGKVYADNAELMSDEVFGTGIDPINLKSGLEECSWNKLTVVPGLNDPNEVATGVIEVTITKSFATDTNNDIRNAITTAVQDKLGITLPGPYDYVLYSVEKCYNDCGWAAYAYINYWNSVYQDVYYKRPGVLMHEIGHNFGLGHSGGLDGQTYTDHSCTMGNPHYGDDGFQCFNPAKNFQLNWYDDAKITEDPNSDGYSKTLKLVGIDEYGNRDNNPVTVRLETGSGADYFIGFNRSDPNGTGPNRKNVEGDNQVTIIQVDQNNGEGYSQSYLRAKLSKGQSYEIPDWRGTGRLVTITVDDIDINATPGFADVTITGGIAPPTPPPSPAPTTLAPTIAEPCPGAQKRLEVQINTDNYPGETRWTVTDKCGTKGAVLSGGPYPTANSFFSSNTCIDDGEYEFKITDSYGDGICCGYGTGSYLAKVGPYVVASGGQFTTSETKFFGECGTPPPTNTPTSPPTPQPTNTPTPSPTNPPTNPPPTSAPTNTPTQLPTNLPTPAPTNTPTTPPTNTPTSSPTNPPTNPPPTSAPSNTPTPPPTSPPTPPPTSPPTNPPPSPAPTNPPTPVPTSPPTPQPTSPPTNPPPSPAPTNPPTPPPTNPPTPKYICGKNEPLPAAICADGTSPGGDCTDVSSANSCGKGGKVCWWAECPGGDGPSPSPPPTSSPPTGGCPVCLATNEECCGTCVDSGKPSNRGCF